MSVRQRVHWVLAEPDHIGLAVVAADADRAPEPAQRTAPDPPKRTAPVGIGPTVPASEIDWAARLASANSESSAMSIPAGTDAVGTESNAPPQRDAASPSAALVGALIFVLLTLWALAAREVSLQQMPPPARRALNDLCPFELGKRAEHVSVNLLSGFCS